MMRAIAISHGDATPFGLSAWAGECVPDPLREPPDSDTLNVAFYSQEALFPFYYRFTVLDPKGTRHH